MSNNLDEKIDEKGAVAHFEHTLPQLDTQSKSAELDALYRAAANEELAGAQSTWQVLKQNPKAFLFLMIISCGAITLGIELSMSGSMLGSQAFCNVMGSYDTASGVYVVDPSHVSIWTAVAAPGQFIGVYLGGLISDRLGRRTAVLGSMFGILLGAIVEVVSNGWQVWALSKGVMGLATGMIQSCTATYVAEVAPRELRGAALIAFQTLTNVGNLFSAVILDLSVQHWTDPTDPRQFRIPLYIMVALPVVIALAIYTCLVESPAWLVIKGRHEQAYKSLRSIYPHRSEQEIELEIVKLRYTVEKEAEDAKLNKSSRWIECFRGTDLRRTLVAATPIVAFVQSGNVVYLLSAYFFSLAGQSNALQSTAIVQTVGIVFNIISSVLVENKRIGRWSLFMVGLFFQAAGMIVIGVIGSVWYPTFANPPPASASALLIAALVISNAGCQLGPQAISWIYVGETGSARLRAKTSSIAQSAAVALGQISGVYFPFMLSTTEYTKWGCKLGYFFGAWGVFFLIVCGFFLPDHTGRSLSQLDESYARKISARKFTETVCTGEYGRDVVEEHGGHTGPAA